ncbi:MAG: hypothetical protein A2X28_09230 [Elusimicrobia bacterium GWA2_56_46]|nr:MAG: hypothetical protein A2X28_09230 [Elusimicrobia bacterium GWA2_56_46]OGR55600.1 MAG: hypothetical protein A2X39_08740 [Elusimicrobia bacterium GWC2_56_31]HBB68343.1 hypothetical protein [Elusimicrobiota bacterium]HBW21992.1 hypothetical protein [Elusimicrobiota bacterium]
MTSKPRKTPDTRLAVGVDRGGTHTRIVLINGLGTELKRIVRPSSGIDRLPDLIERTAAAWGLKPHIPVVIATRGALTKKWKKTFLLKKLKGRVNLVDVISDAQAAYLAAHGSRTGALLIAGTGSVLFHRHPGGRFKKTGGHGSGAGDPGSGLWIGARFLKGAVPAVPHWRSLDRRAIAAYAAKAVRKAEKGDPAAIKLISEAHDRLSGLLTGAVRISGRRDGGKPLRVALTGGLMQNAFFRKTFIARARRRFAPYRLVFIGLRRPAEQAAAGLAMGIYARNKNA